MYTFKIKYCILCALIFPVVARINFYNTGLEFGAQRYLAPIIVGGAAGFLIGLMKDRWMNINQNLELKVIEKTKALNDKIEKLEHSESQNVQLIGELEAALSEVKTLSGLMPICAQCKKIRDDNGYWKQIEGYIQSRSDASFSHGICPECAKILYPDLDIHD